MANPGYHNTNEAEEKVECVHCYKTFTSKARLVSPIRFAHQRLGKGNNGGRNNSHKTSVLVYMGANNDYRKFPEEGYGWYMWQPPPFVQGKFQWVQCHNGQLPSGCVPVGRDKDGSPLYAGRANHSGDLLPAKVKPNHHGAYVAWGGGEHMKHQYEVLVSNDIAWKYSRDGIIPPQAMVVGHTSTGENLYLGRAYHDGTITPGKVHPTHRCLYIPYDCKEVPIKEYEIMVLL